MGLGDDAKLFTATCCRFPHGRQRYLLSAPLSGFGWKWEMLRAAQDCGTGYSRPCILFISIRLKVKTLEKNITSLSRLSKAHFGPMASSQTKSMF